MKKPIMLNTKRLKIFPLTPEQLELLIFSTDKLDAELGLNPCNIEYDEDIIKAFKTMHTLTIEHPELYVWYTNWVIILKGENRLIGGVGFKGSPNNNHEVEVGYEINKHYQGKGSMTEALEAIISWAFLQNGVYYIQAQTEENNNASRKLLNKCKFKQIGVAEEGLLYEREKDKTYWMSIFMCIGLSIGSAFGVSVFNNIGVSISIGMCLGVTLGIAFDEMDKRARKRT